MTTPSVLVPDLEKLETAIKNVVNLRPQDGEALYVLEAANFYLQQQRMIATDKEDYNSTESVAYTKRYEDAIKSQSKNGWQDTNLPIRVCVALGQILLGDIGINAIPKPVKEQLKLICDSIGEFIDRKDPPITNGESE